VGFCIAAAMAGRKVMTATSGPGINLYGENVGMAVMGETPMVIVNVQRQGPSTGSATKGAEGDILLTRWLTSGGLPMIALSPTNVAEAYELTFRAFNLAERFRTPVFLLTNKEIGVTKESVDLSEIQLPPLFTRKKIHYRKKEYLPHYFEKIHDIPHISDFGGDHIARFTTSTHDKTGYLTTNPEVIEEMIEHYNSKIYHAVDDITLVKKDYQKGADSVIISYGITSRSAAVAVRKARLRGKKVNHLTLLTLFPTPDKIIKAAAKGMKKVIVPEMNMGQYVLTIERLTGDSSRVVRINQMNTKLISPETILNRGGLL
jgi:2-oxoglutarate ferredoxin oxidoreductase subunit alpha